MKPQMNTDKHRSVLLSRKFFATRQGFSSTFFHRRDAGREKKLEKRQFRACKLLKTKGRIFRISIISHVRGVRREVNLMVSFSAPSAVRFLVAAGLLGVHLWFHSFAQLRQRQTDFRLCPSLFFLVRR